MSELPFMPAWLRERSGAKKPSGATTSGKIKEYTISVPQEKIDRLMKRLDDTEFPTELEDGPEWQYGTPM